MKGKNVFRITLLILFVLFISLYIVGNSSYYDYEASTKAQLTKEEIVKFEEDIKNGEKIDLQEYQKDRTAEYDNLISKTTLKISNKIGKTVEKGINYLFNKLAGVMNS